MQEIFINKDNLSKEEIDREVTRVKALIINSKNEILLGYSYHEYQFPGGHVENGENIYDAMKREIKEETGIDVKKETLKPFICIKYFSKNYRNSGENRCNKLYYFVVKTDNEINLLETNYTEEEREGNYVLRYFNLDDVEDVIIDNCNRYPGHKSMVYEMLIAIDKYKNKER